MALSEVLFSRMEFSLENLVSKHSKVKELKKSLPWHMLNPDSIFANIWNYIVLLLLVYTATLMPF